MSTGVLCAWTLVAHLAGVYSKDYGSLTFVIDETGSMRPVINAVIDGVDSIAEIILSGSSQIKDMVLVTFNDPFDSDTPKAKLLVNTVDRSVLHSTLENVEIVSGSGGDCPEMSLHGVKLGLRNSRPNSMLYVFTDAAPKDPELTDDVKGIAQRLGCQVSFIVTPPGVCSRYSNEPYYDIASSTNGQVFILERKEDVKYILPYIETLISGENNAISTATVQPSLTQWTFIPFEIDRLTDYVVIAAAGINVEFKLIPEHSNNEKITWLNSVKAMKLVKPKPGKYQVKVRGRSTTSIMIFGRTNFTFQHGFSLSKPTSLKDTDTQPTEGTKYHLCVSVDDPGNSVDIKTAQILNMDSTLIKELPLTRVSGGFYATELFESPDKMFTIAVQGIGKTSKEAIRRDSNTPIKPLRRRNKPTIAIEGLKNSYDFNEALRLICKVKAYPEPDIVWTDGDGNVVPSETIPTNPPYEYSSHIKQVNARKSQTYRCTASNGLGVGHSDVTVHVKSPFTKLKVPVKVYKEYEQDVILQCNIRSNHNFKVHWIKVGETKKIEPSDKFSIESKNLRIKKISEHHEGVYNCTAMLSDDESITDVSSFQVVIKNTAPVIKMEETIMARQGSPVKFKCNIVKGYPRPKLTWNIRKFISNKIIANVASGTNEYQINSVDLLDSGYYFCQASNSFGEALSKTTLYVEAPPKVEMFVNEKLRKSVTVDYGSKVYIKCVVTASPPIQVKWTDSRLSVIRPTPVNKPTKLNYSFEFISIVEVPDFKKPEDYYCTVKNNLGKVNGSVQVTIASPFIETPSRQEPVNVAYGREAILDCNTKAIRPSRTVWYRVLGMPEREEVIEVSDKFSFPRNEVEKYKLQINKMDIGLDGKYKCKVTLVEDETYSSAFIHDVRISGLEAPKINRNNPVITVKENQPLIVKCPVSHGVPKPTQSWEIKHDSSGNIKKVSGNIIINSVSLKDAGHYKCIVANEMGRDELDMKLIVQAPPRINLDSDKTTFIALEGDKHIRIPCNVTGHPAPVVTWKINDNKTIRATDKDYTAEHNALVIHHPSVSDGIMFITCEAKNDFGTVSQMFNAYVSTSPKVKIFANKMSRESIAVEYGSSVSLLCVVTASPPVHVKWTDNRGVVIPPTSDTNTAKPNHSLQSKTFTIIPDFKKPKTFSCTATNNLGTLTKSVLVSIASPFIETETRKEYVEAVFGREAILDCNTKAIRPSRTVWYRVLGMPEREEVIEVSDKFSFPRNEVEKYKLQINKMDTGLDGKYKCKVTLVEDETYSSAFIHDVRISGLEVPKINRNNPVMTVKEKHPVTIKCPISQGVPEPKQSWEIVHDGSEKVKFENGNIIINSVGLTDAGRYRCIVVNEIGRDEFDIKLIVEAPPKIHFNRSDKHLDENTFTAVEGDIVLRIPCKVTGYPKPEVLWKINFTETIQITNSKFSIEDDWLVIHYPLESDGNSFFTCEARNEFGVDNKTFSTIIYKDLPEQEIVDVSDVCILKGESKSLKCHYPGDIINWFKEGQNINVTGSLNITEATYDYDGNYTCRASTRLGTEAHTFVLHVGYAPDFGGSDQNIIIDWDGDFQILDCRVDMKPGNGRTVKIQWTRNEQILENFDEMELAVTKWGTYTCHISNCFGSTKKTFHVTSSTCLIKANPESYNAPVFVSDNEEAWPALNTMGAYFNLDNGQNLRLSCNNQTEAANAFRVFPDNSEIIATCDHEDQFKVGERTYNFADLTCNDEVQLIKRTGNKCFDDDSELIKVGFNSNDFIDWYEVCFDNVKKVPHYTKVKMTEPNNDYIPTYKWRSYLQFGEDRNEAHWNNGLADLCFVKSQLVNVRDVKSGSAQAATFIDFLNSVPVSRSCSSNYDDDWADVETYFRQLYDSPVWTGASHYSNIDGRWTPRYLWKVAEVSGALAAVVRVNAPSWTTSDVLCRQIPCTDLELISTYSQRTYCCQIDDFSTAFRVPLSVFSS